MKKGPTAARHVPIGLILLVIALAPAQGALPPLDSAEAWTIPEVCPPRENQREPRNEAERLEFERRERYRQLLPMYFARVPVEPDTQLLMPVEGVRVAGVADTWGGPRSGGRSHEGQDIFAPRGTPVFSATSGYVYRIGQNPLGGNVVVVIGAGGRRYYYAHLEGSAKGLVEGQAVTVDTLLGYVGDSGNAGGTPPHLHLGMYGGSYQKCDWNALDPLPFLVDR